MSYPSIGSGVLVLVATSVALAAGCGSPPPPDGSGPAAYVVVVHVNPVAVIQPSDPNLSRALDNVRREVADANTNGVKLSLFFSAATARYAAADAARRAEVQSWIAQGHEVGLHHHSTLRPTEWDGYTPMSPADAEATRIRLAGGVEAWGYLGSLVDLMALVKQLDPDVRSGVCSEYYGFEDAIPDEIRYLTASGYLNTGPVGTPQTNPSDVRAARNDYVSKGLVRGIERKWLTHYELRTGAQLATAQESFRTMSGGIFALVEHNMDENLADLKSLAEYLHGQDPSGSKSLTISAAIESGLVPEEELPDALH